MNARDEKIRDVVNDGLNRANVDPRNLVIELVDGHLTVKGTVPSLEQQDALMDVLRTNRENVVSLDCDVRWRQVAASDSADGRGRSPVTGTSADSAHESRHQLDCD